LAADAADAVLVGRDLSAVDRALDTLADTRRRVRENLAWAFLYNAVAVPAAVLGVITPLIAAVAMAASSLLVVGNTTRPLGPDSGSDDADEPASAADPLQPAPDAVADGGADLGADGTIDDDAGAGGESA
ncbi:MAG: hypothetical protein ACOCQL_06490, partial [Halolamina sp.]